MISKEKLNIIYEACQQFRNAIIKTDKEKLPCNFRLFPKGCCGDSCYMLGAFLESIGLGVFDYVCGWRDEYSHAWLEKDDIIVDIASDQFKDGNDSVYVGMRNDFLFKI